MTAYFVTSTGADIGKTFVTAGLIRHLRGEGRPATALKPLVSGYDSSVVETSDPAVLLRAMGRSVTADEIAAIAPFRFRAPLSPDLAAAREGRSVDFDALLGFSRDAVAAHDGTLLIEGVGGIMVPLDECHTVLDWITALSIPAIVMSGSYLGAISHALTALDALRGRGLATAALVVNETPQSSVALDETAATIARFAAGVPVITLPRLAQAEQPHPAIERLTELLDRF